MRPVSASRYLRGLLVLPIPLSPELFIRVLKLGRWFLPTPVETPVLGGLLAVSELEFDVEVLDGDGKTGLEVFSGPEVVLLGAEGAAPFPRPAICTFFGVIGPKSSSFWTIASRFEVGPSSIFAL